jgi:hypothetical protein
LSNLASVNANEVNTDVLTKSDPDITDTQFDQLFGINTNQTIQQQINAINAALAASGYYGLYASDNNPANNPVNTERKFYYNNTLGQNGFSITGGTGINATRITAANAGVYNIYYKANYQKVNTGNSYDVRTWIMKNGFDLPFSTTINTLFTNPQFRQLSGYYTVTLAAGEYVEVAWLVVNANSSTDILDFQAISAPYPAVSSQFVAITQLSVAGPAGASGGTGPQGPVGPQGATGPAGLNGATGATGPQGPAGSGGATGPRGDKGDKGDKGNQGDPGPQGPQGETNPTAIAALATAVAAQATATAAAAAIVVTNGVVNAQGTAISTLQGQVGTLQTEMTTANTNITALQTKTQLQSFDSLNIRTQFTNDLQLTGTATYRGAQIITTGSGTFFNVNTTEDINAGTDITATESITAGTDLSIGGIAYLNRTQPSAKKLVLYDNNTGNNYEYLGMSVSTDSFNQFLNYNVNTAASEHRFLYGTSAASAKQILALNPTTTNLTTNSLDLRAKDILPSANRDAGIDIVNISSLSADLGQLSIRGGIINIGNASGASVVNINGLVNIPNANNFSMIGSFFSQF